jgi:hypothetical protein
MPWVIELEISPRSPKAHPHIALCEIIGDLLRIRHHIDCPLQKSQEVGRRWFNIWDPSSDAHYATNVSVFELFDPEQFRHSSVNRVISPRTTINPSFPAAQELDALEVY